MQYLVRKDATSATVQSRFAEELLEKAPKHGRAYSIRQRTCPTEGNYILQVIDDADSNADSSNRLTKGKGRLQSFTFRASLQSGQLPGGSEDAARRVSKTFCKLLERVPFPMPLRGTKQKVAASSTTPGFWQRFQTAAQCVSNIHIP